MNKAIRPDLPNQTLYLLPILIALMLVVALYGIDPQTPGTVFAQWCGAIGTLLLLAPLLFSVMKRGGLSDSPPLWFVVHVVFASLGICLILLHVAGGDWLTPPGLVLALLLFLLLQGVLLRGLVSEKFAYLFARNSSSRGFASADSLDKEKLAAIIEQKTQYLARLDANASEALFSPNLRHWFMHPWRSLRYQLLVEREARMVGARSSAGALLAWSRRIHLLAALLFYLGLFAHIVVVLFFAGYAADGGEIDWWYITDWGR